MPSPSPPRRQPPSPASSFTSAVSYVPAAENWTIAGLRQVLTSSGVTIPSRSTKPDLLALYASLRSGELPNSSPPFKAVPKASQGRSVPYARPKQTTTPSRMSSRPLGHIRRPSASPGQTPDAAAISPHPPSRTTEHKLATHSGEEPAFASTSRRARASTPPLATKSHPNLAIIAELALSYGGSHFYTYHKLFAAKCAIQVTQWNQAPYWGALDTELHNRVFLGCRNITCAVCRSISHSTTTCPFIKPSIPPCPEPPQPKSTSYVPNIPHASSKQSALTEPETVDILIKKEIDANFMIGPFSVPPFNIFRVSPIGIATRKFSGKKRLIIDLSSPYNSPFPSINSLIPLEEFSLHYHDIDQAITLIKTAGRGAWLVKIDITSAFKIMPIHPDFWHLFGIHWQENLYFSVRLTFGCRSSPKIFDMLSEAICWILSNNYDVPYLVHLLDDFLIISPPDSIPAAHLSTTQTFFSELGIPLTQDKTAGPSTSIEFLGINLDSQKFQASLPKEKIDRTILVASTLLANPSCSKRELLSILGHLNFAMRIIPQGRPFVSHLLSLASSAHALEDQITLTVSCCDELNLWISFLKQWNGLSFFYNNLISSPADIQLFTDAAPSVGFGGFYQGR